MTLVLIVDLVFEKLNHTLRGGMLSLKGSGELERSLRLAGERILGWWVTLPEMWGLGFNRGGSKKFKHRLKLAGEHFEAVGDALWDVGSWIRLWRDWRTRAQTRVCWKGFAAAAARSDQPLTVWFCGSIHEWVAVSSKPVEDSIITRVRFRLSLVRLQLLLLPNATQVIPLDNPLNTPLLLVDHLREGLPLLLSLLLRDTHQTSQGNGQSTHQKPTQYIANTFRISQANFIAVFLVQEMPSTFTVFQVM
jgi:hypothetical protein